MRFYEGMFLFDNAFTHEWAAVEAEVKRLCDRIGAELLVCVKFDERRLAYEIKKRKRGTFVLTYFNVEPERIADLERDVQLSESVLRVLVLRAEGVSAERIKELQERTASEALQPGGGERDRGPRDRYDRGSRDRYDRGSRERGERGERGSRDRGPHERYERDSESADRSPEPADATAVLTEPAPEAATPETPGT